MTEFVQMRGLDEAVAALRALPGEFASKNGGPIRGALYKAAAIIRDDAIARAPSDSGNLKLQIYLYRDRNPRQKNNATERYYVSVRRGQGKKRSRIRVKGKFAGRTQRVSARDAYYFRFPEFGTEHQRAQPFLRPAFENNKVAAVTEFTKTMIAGVAGAVKRARKKGGG